VVSGEQGGRRFAAGRQSVIRRAAGRSEDVDVVQIDIPVAFGTGSLLAAAVEQGLRSERASYFYQRALVANLLFQILLVVWLPVYLLVAHFGFQTSHMWWTEDSITDYPWLLPCFLAAYFLANVAGFDLGARLVQRGRTRVVWLLFLGGFVFFGVWMAVQPYRTLSLGTYADWRAGTARWIWTDAGFVALLLGDMVLFFVALAWIFRRLRRESQQAARAVARH
jgi:hypothetical protein